MMRVLENVWVGNSRDECIIRDIDAILNVAVDLEPSRNLSDGVEYVHVGLVDGPGNPPEMYVAAVMALVALVAAWRS